MHETRIRKKKLTAGISRSLLYTAVLGLTSLLFFAGACAKGRKKPAPSREGKVLARIGRRKIYQSEIKALIEQMPERRKVGWEAEDEARTAAFVRRYVRTEVLLERAKKQDVDRQPKVQWEIDDFSRHLIVSTYLQEEADRRVKIEPEEVEQYYREHIRGFTQPNRARVKVIKMGTEEKAKEILARLEKGEDFAGLASSESKDKKIKRIADDWEHVSGVGTFFGIEKAVFSLKPGEYTREPLKRTDFYYLFQMEELMPAKNKPFSEIKDKVEFALRRMKWKKARDRIIEEALEEAGVEFYLAI